MNEQAMKVAQEHGGKRGWKSRMPAMPEDLPAGGEWMIDKRGGRRTLVYRLDGANHVIGELEAPGVNGTGRLRQAQPAEGRVESTLTVPAPLILIEPGAEGTRFNAYGLELPEVIEELRRALVHLVATSAGVEVISLTIPRAAAVVVERAPVRPEPQRRPAKGKLKRTVSYGGLHDEDLDDDEDGWR